MSFESVSLSATILASAVGTHLALSPPNPVAQKSSASDSIHRLGLTNLKIVTVPVSLLSLHASILAYFYPKIPQSAIRHGLKNGLEPSLFTWTPATAIPLALILGVGVPLRLIPYSSLGKDFTFAITKPDRLVTSGIYRYLQHPSYTGIATVVLGNASLLLRLRGVLSCWIPPKWHPILLSLEWPIGLFLVTLFLFGIRTRVRQEERLLQAEFGDEWRTWHAHTARFIPFLF